MKDVVGIALAFLGLVLLVFIQPRSFVAPTAVEILATNPSSVWEFHEERSVPSSASVCESPIPSNASLHTWRDVLTKCGEAHMVSTLSTLDFQSHRFTPEFTHEFYRPFSMEYALPVVVDTFSNHSHLFFMDQGEAPDSGRCWRMASDTFKCLPSLLIIGVQRASTRELFEWLNRHPLAHGYGSVESKQSVETHFFDSLASSQKEFHSLQPIQRKSALGPLESVWYSEYVGQSPAFTLDQVVHSRFVFDKTPAYFDQADPHLIQWLLPNVKLLLSLREPGARLWSAYWKRCKPAQCSLEDFVSVYLEPAETCFPSSETQECLSFFRSGYELRAVQMGCYANFLQRYQAVLKNTHQLLVVFAEEFMLQPFAVMEEIEAFAGLTPFDFKSQAKWEEKSNLYYLSATSKVLKPKLIQYVSFAHVPHDIKARIWKLYETCNRQLEATTRLSDFILLSKFQPLWFSQIHALAGEKP